jgi:ribosomal protein S4
MKTKSERKRLDLLLVERGLAESRHKAQAMILAGEVEVDQHRTEKAGTLLRETAHIEVRSRLQKYASRGGLKLEGAGGFSCQPCGKDLPRRWRIHRRVHRLPAARRRGARLRRGREHRPAELEVA